MTKNGPARIGASLALLLTVGSHLAAPSPVAAQPDPVLWTFDAGG